LAEYLTDLRANFGSDHLVIAGDFNADKWRRPFPSNHKERASLQIVRNLEEDNFQICPSTDVVTYVDSSTTIDYVIVFPSILLNNFAMLPVGLCQHLTLRAKMSIPVEICASALPLRSPNLIFVPTRVARVQELLGLL
jgi:hypothetical protein